MSRLFSIDRWDFVYISQLISCACKLVMYSFQFNLQSKCSTRYCTTSVWRMRVFLLLTTGQCLFWRVKWMWDDLDSLNLIFHFFRYFSMLYKSSWILSEAIVGSSWFANIAVLSANVSNVVLWLLVSQMCVVKREQDQECCFGAHRNGCRSSWSS
jgi:hypothetical protein